MQPQNSPPAAEGTGFLPELFLVGVNTPTCAAYLIDKPSFVFGKSEQCDGCLAFSDEISREHARIDYREGHYTVTDLGSTNLTFLNGAPLAPQTETPLSPGDRLAFSVFQFDVDRINRT